MNFENATNTLSFRPIDFWTSGKTYFFQIVIKEANSDSVQYVYYCQVKINGTVFERNETIPWVNVNYAILEITDDSRGSMKFSERVKMDYLRQNDTFYKMFNIFYRDINFKDN